MWETPIDFFKQYEKLYDLKLDVCATKENKKCNDYFDVDQDGLEQEWDKNFWMNPPYGRQIGKWIKKAYNEHLKYGVTGVLLLPSRTDTKWFHDYCVKGKLEFIKGRLKFGGQKNPAPFPSLVVIFKK